MGNLGSSRSEALNENKNAGLVVGEKFGRLANQLWLFAHVIAHGIESRTRVWNPCFDEHARYFTGPSRGIIPAYPPFGGKTAGQFSPRSLAYLVFVRVLGRLGNRHRHSDFFSVVRTGMNDTFDLSRTDFANLEQRKRLIVLAGWRFRDYNAFERNEDEIRSYFQPSTHIAANVRAILAEARRGSDVLVGLHMRAGDYRTFLEGKYYYSPQQYRSLTDRIAFLFPGRKVRFLICSDEPVDRVAFSGVDFTAGSGHPVEDLISFSGCDYIVGPPSTYTMWSSFFGKVPLLVVRDVSGTFDLSGFRVIDGRFDADAEVV